MIRCWFGHTQKFVGINEIPMENPYPGVCHHGYHFRDHCDICRNSAQVAMWVCEHCPKMGAVFIKRSDGIFTVSFGKLVPDEKAWSNYTAIEKAE